MENIDLYFKNLTGKDELKAQQAAEFLVNSARIDLFKKLIDKSDYLFDFVKNNVAKRIEKVINKENYTNLIKFFEIYSTDYDDLFASILAKHANQDLTDDIFEILENGTTAQKTYAAKYFSYIPDTVALEALSKYSLCDEENLAFNSAEALGQMQDDISYDIALSLLSSNDDFERLKAVKFFTAYNKNYPLKEIIKIMKISKMAENIAGQIPYCVSLKSLLSSDLFDALDIIDNILSGFGEILPLSDIFQFEMYDCLEILINKNKTDNEFSSKIANVLLKSLIKFKMFCENQEYVFDEDKDTKYEINAVLKLLQSQNSDFWNAQKELTVNQLNKSQSDILSVLPVISELKITSAVSGVKNLLNSDDEIIIYEAANSLKQLNALDEADKNFALSKISNPNIKAMIENF